MMAERCHDDCGNRHEDAAQQVMMWLRSMAHATEDAASGIAVFNPGSCGHMRQNDVQFAREVRRTLITCS